MAEWAPCSFEVRVALVTSGMGREADCETMAQVALDAFDLSNDGDPDTDWNTGARIAHSFPAQRGNAMFSNLQVFNALLYMAEQAASGVPHRSASDAGTRSTRGLTAGHQRAPTPLSVVPA